MPLQRGPHDLAGRLQQTPPLWDEDRNNHLFTPAALEASGKLLGLIADHGMTQILPKDILTLQSSSTRNWTRPDNTFCTEHTSELLLVCNTVPEKHGPKTDHLPILTMFDMSMPASNGLPTWNYQSVDWEKFNSSLKDSLTELSGHPRILETAEEFQQAVHNLDQALHRTVEAAVSRTQPHPHTKRWWTKDLTKITDELKQLRKTAHRYRALLEHKVHTQVCNKENTLSKEIKKTKEAHWKDWLNNMADTDIWIAHKYMSNPGGDGRKTCIPMLQRTDPDGQVIQATSNEEKSTTLHQQTGTVTGRAGRASQSCTELYSSPQQFHFTDVAQALFPPPPNESTIPTDYLYPESAEKWSEITHEQLMQAINNLSPYKAPGPDGVANIVFQCCRVLIDHLLPLFNAAVNLRMYYNPWKESITVILRKPGKPDYSIPKAYRPIALLNTTAKLLLAIVADHTSYILESHNLLPNTHFSGWPGRSTEDSLHLLKNTIHHAWRQGKVVSALFLNIEGTFPNAVTDRLIHSMKCHRLPPKIISFMERLLQGRRTKLQFNNYTSKWFNITNGIGQGDPLSMILYIIYDSDLIRTAKGRQELTLAFVDDTAFLAIGNTFQETHQILNDMLERSGGGFKWSSQHNSRFAPSKFMLIDFSMNRTKECPPMIIHGATITPSPSHKFLRVILDQELRWREHTTYATAKGAHYAMLLRRLSKSAQGVPTKLIHQLYQAVVIPHTLYAASVWLRPTYNAKTNTTVCGSTGTAKRIGQTQRTVLLAITGAMKSSPSDSLEVHANSLPGPLLIQHILHNSLLRISTLPSHHPLSAIMNHIAKCSTIKHHKSALHHLLQNLAVNPRMMETIHPHPVHPDSCSPSCP